MTPYLFAHPNRHAPKRADGHRFWGYPTRSQPVRLIGVHTTESLFDMIGKDAGAESVAAYQASTDRPSSYHRIVDRDSTVVCLPDEATAFGIGNLNSPTLHLAFAMRATDWLDPKKAKAAQPMLERGALVAAEWCRERSIPTVRLTRALAFGTGTGFIPHGVADPTRRSDPGAGFPWPAFFALIRAELDPRPAPEPAVPRTPTGDRWLGLHEPPLQGQDVLNVQNALILTGFLSEHPAHRDGRYTRLLADAVGGYKATRGINEAGVGPLTWAALRKDVHS